jgi:hypothetical protein
MTEEKRRLSNVELGNAIARDYTTASRLRSGKRNLSLDVAQIVLLRYGWSLDEQYRCMKEQGGAAWSAELERRVIEARDRALAS